MLGILETQEQSKLVASNPYTQAGISSFRALVHDENAKVPISQHHTAKDILHKSVLASAFLPQNPVTGHSATDVYLPLPYSDPIKLIPYNLQDFRPQLAYDNNRNCLGTLLNVPPHLVSANLILGRRNEDGEWGSYDYEQAIADMVLSAVSEFAHSIKRGFIKHREKPGAMANLIEDAEMEEDEVGMSTDFAYGLYRKMKTICPEHITNVWDLDGFPVYGIRFPMANRYGVQRMRLRLMSGKGKYFKVNPFNTVKRFLGDRDGDSFFVIPMGTEVNEGKEVIERRPLRINRTSVTAIDCPYSALDIFGRDSTVLTPRHLEKMTLPMINTADKAAAAITAADVRTYVGIYTTCIAWYGSRVLAKHPDSGCAGPQEAHMKAYDALESILEVCMDTRKPDSIFKDFDHYSFMNTLINGGADLPISELERIGMPKESIETMQLVWALSDQNPREWSSSSPIYNTFVLERKQIVPSLHKTFAILNDMGVTKEQIYSEVVNDLMSIN